MCQLYKVCSYFQVYNINFFLNDNKLIQTSMIAFKQFYCVSIFLVCLICMITKGLAMHLLLFWILDKLRYILHILKIKLSSNALLHNQFLLPTHAKATHIAFPLTGKENQTLYT